MDDQPQVRPAGWFRELFVVDLRSLAAMRIALGLVILADLATRSRHLVAHYTDLGIAPRATLVDEYGDISYLSLHVLLSGSTAAEACLFVLHGLVAIALALGCWTRIATVICWYLSGSLMMRLPLLGTGGDATLQLLLFWSMFLPLGARWSLDRHLRRPPRLPANDYVSVAGMALLLQICFIYWLSVILKLNSPVWTSGQALGFSLHADAYVTSAGVWLRQAVALLPVLTYATLVTEAVGPALSFIPRFTVPGRLIAVAIFLTLHSCMGIFLQIGVFSFISMTGWLAFLPGPFWDALERRFTATRDAVPREELRPTRLTNQLAAIFFLCVCVLGVRALPIGKRFVPEFVENLGYIAGLRQGWAMFTTPTMRVINGWFVIPGELADGRTVDLLAGGGIVTWEEPEVATELYESFRWKFCLYRQRPFLKSPFWPHYAEYLCRQWNDRHAEPDRLSHVSIEFMLRREFRDPPSIERIVLYELECAPPAPQN